jgi:hypothetical protein
MTKDNQQMTFPMYILKFTLAPVVIKLFDLLKDDKIKACMRQPQYQQRIFNDFLLAPVADTRVTVLQLLQIRFQQNEAKDSLMENLTAWVTEVFAAPASPLAATPYSSPSPGPT